MRRPILLDKPRVGFSEVLQRDQSALEGRDGVPRVGEDENRRFEGVVGEGQASRESALAWHWPQLTEDVPVEHFAR